MTQQQLKKRIEDLEQRTGIADDDAAKLPDVIMFVAQYPNGAQWPQEPFNREDFNVRTSPRGPEWWHPKPELMALGEQVMQEQAQKAD